MGGEYVNSVEESVIHAMPMLAYRMLEFKKKRGNEFIQKKLTKGDNHKSNDFEAEMEYIPGNNLKRAYKYQEMATDRSFSVAFRSVDLILNLVGESPPVEMLLGNINQEDVKNMFSTLFSSNDKSVLLNEAAPARPLLLPQP